MATTDQVVLQGKFNIKKSLYNVNLKEHEITWLKDRKDRSQRVTGTVCLDDVICITRSSWGQNTKGPEEKKHPSKAEGRQNNHNGESDDVSKSKPKERTGVLPYFTLHYVTKKSSHVWKVDTVKFQSLASTNQEDIDPWVTYIRDYCSRLNRPKRLLVFINPISGSRKGVKIYDTSARPLFDLAAVVTEVVITESKDHIDDYLAEQDLSSFDGIVSVGGDGTFVQCFNALLQRIAKSSGQDLDDPYGDPIVPSLPIGIIPAGSDQMLVQDATLTSDPVTATLHIITGQRYRAHAFSVYNAGKLLRFGTLISGYGLLGDVIGQSEKPVMRRIFGRARYVVASFTQLLKPRKYSSKLLYKPVVPSAKETETTPQNEANEKKVEADYEVGRFDPNEDGNEETAAKVDGERTATLEKGWESIQGRFCTLLMLIVPTGTNTLEKRLAENQITRPDPNVPTMYLFQLRDTCSRLKIAKSFTAMFDGTGSTLEHEYAIKAEALEYKLEILDADQLSDNNNVWAIDGEPFRLKDKTVHVGSHANLVPMFGMGLWNIINATEKE